MKQNSKKNYVITSLALYFTYFIHGIGASVLGQYKPQFAKVWGATVGSDGTVDVSMVVSVRPEVKRNDRGDLLRNLFLRNCIFTVDGSCLCICHCGRNCQLLLRYLCKSDMYGDLCQ